MKAKLLLLIDNTLARYVLIGGTSFVVEISFLFLLTSLGIDEILAVAIAFWIGFITAFILQKIFTFKNTTKHVKHLAQQSIAYGILVGFNYLITVIFVSLFSPLIGLFISRAIILLITTGWNFIIYKKMIFKEIK